MSSVRSRGKPRPFLTAAWRHLAMLNYEVPPALVRPLVPRGTALDSWRGRTFVSLVGFLFADTRVFGVPVPFHRTFEEVNLRFYVRREVDGELRRGVTFIRELVPRALVARVAHAAYNEPYTALRMRHRVADDHGDAAPSAVEYDWKASSGWCGMRVEPTGLGVPAAPGSEEEFITEHYWGYTRQRDGSTIEYRVEHPAWRVWRVKPPRLFGDLEGTYGASFAATLSAAPSSAFYADGSAVTVGRPTRLEG